MFDFFLRLARSRPGCKLVGWTFAHMSFAIPVERLRETETLLAFYHPKPAYPLHVLLVPKQAAFSLMELDPSSGFLSDLITTVQSLVAELQLPAYRLIVNGGEYQDSPLLHFHLISNSPSPLAPFDPDQRSPRPDRQSRGGRGGQAQGGASPGGRGE